MSVIIRLQNLPWTANARDIRNFFTGLSIPEGGVHIIGGEMGDAFIAFSTDEDARCAMLKDRDKLMEVQVRLLLSSRAEMQKVIETARKKAAAPEPAPAPAAPIATATAAALPVAMPAAPQPPIIGVLNSFLPQSKQAAATPSFLAYQQQAGITLADVTIGASKSPERPRYSSSRRRHSRSRSRSRSRSSSSDDSDSRERSRERERERARKRRSERADSTERELKSQPQTMVPALSSSSTSAAVTTANLLPWALSSVAAPPAVDALAAYKLAAATNGAVGLVASMPPSLQSYSTSTNSTTVTSNNYNVSLNAGPAALPPNVLQALKAAATANGGEQIPGLGQGHVVAAVPPPAVAAAAAAPTEPIAFANVNPYAQMYPQLFQQQQLLLQQQSSPKSSPSMSNACATAETCYIKISNMCPSTTYSDLRKYFAGLYIPHNGIRFSNGHGARTGTAYIEFSRVSSAQKALTRNNTLFRDRLVQIVPVGDEEFEQAEQRAAGSVASPSGSNESSSPLSRSGGGAGGGAGSGSTCNVLYVEDLPQLTTEQDILKMFSATSTIVDILLAPSPNNRREFVAFVHFARDNEARLALEDASRHYIGFRKLRVRASHLAEMQCAKDKLRRANEQLLKEEQQQQQQQSDKLANEAANGMSPHSRYNNDPRRRAAVDNEVTSLANAAPPAMQTFANTGLPNGNMPFPPNSSHNNNNNNNNNGAYALSLDNNNGNTPFNNNINNDGSGAPQERRRTDEQNFVRVHNCEYGTRINDLGELFMTENLRIVHIEMLYNERNMPAGEFIVEFGDVHNAKAAIREFHNRRFRGRGLRVLHITPQEIADRMGKPFMDYVPGGNGPRGNEAAPLPPPPQQQQSRRRGPSRFNDITNRPSAMDNDEASNLKLQQQQQQQHFNPFAVRAGNDEIALPGVLPNDDGLPAPNAGNGSNNGAGNSNVLEADGIPDKFNRPGCVVAMRNVPFKADLKDILRFFSDYKLTPDDIIRRFNDDGKPTGDARVAFETPADARAAYESRRRRQIFNRNVYLDIV